MASAVQGPQENLGVGTATLLPRRGNWLREVPWAPAGILLFLVALAILGPFVSPHSPYEMAPGQRLLPPFWDTGGKNEHLLGTDTLGRDSLSRLIYGARISLLVGLLATIAGGGTGLSLGIASGYLGGRVDAAVMRLVDATMSFPPILLALLFAVLLGPGWTTVILALALVLWAPFARIIRGEVLSIKEKDFVQLARVAGCPPFRIMAVHILPNVLNSFMVLVSLNFGSAILAEASLSFLGAGIPPPTPTWGQMVSEGRQYIATAWWLSLIPGVLILLTVLSLSLTGDWVRDRLDPKLRGAAGI